MVKVSNNDDLKDAIKRGESRIEIEGDLAKKVIRLKATGKVAWLIAGGAVGVAVMGLIILTPTTVVTGGLAAPVEAGIISAAIAPAATIIGLDVAMMAVGLAIAAGGVGILTRLRSDYKIVEQAPNRAVLVKV